MQKLIISVNFNGSRSLYISCSPWPKKHHLVIGVCTYDISAGKRSMGDMLSVLFIVGWKIVSSSYELRCC